MHRRLAVLIAGLPGALVLAGALFLPAPVPAEETVRIGGTGSALGPMNRLAAAYRSRPGEARILIPPSMGSSGGIKAVAEGALDIGLSSRPLTDGERGQGLVARELCRTPFVLAAGKRVNVDGLTLPEVIGMYGGEVTAWPTGERVRIVLRPASDIDTSIIRSISPDLAAALDKARAREGMLMALTDQENADLLEKTPGAVGFLSLTQYITEQPQVRVLVLDGVKPAEQGIANRSYPHMKKLYVVTKDRPSPAASRFLFFAASPEGRRILEAAGTIPAAIHRP